ncbi:unnamed protein product [Mycena citricolor]|uniref:Uncharacterized protein n=1 Tax=Mycena citricolor TaxID=2018698 RepID=A0AAD2H4V3_9AGAR|nr:unnamed protein product [Mycena citricolor]
MQDRMGDARRITRTSDSTRAISCALRFPKSRFSVCSSVQQSLARFRGTATPWRRWKRKSDSS